MFRDLLLRRPRPGELAAVVGVCRESSEPLAAARVTELLESSGLSLPTIVSDRLLAEDEAEVAAIEIAEFVLDGLLDRLTPAARALVELDESLCVDADDLTMKLWEECWRLDSDRLSFQRRTPPDAAPPHAA